MSIQDVLVNTSSFDTDLMIRFPSPMSRISLGHDVYVDFLESDIFGCVVTACDPPGYKYDLVGTRGQVYSFIRENPPENTQWDPDGRLQEVVALSRLIVPSPVGLRYGARVHQAASGEIERVVPADIHGLGDAAFVADPRSRTWLTADEFGELRCLFRLFRQRKLPLRVTRAMFYLEYAFRIFEIDVRWVLVVTGLEALVHTDQHASGRQFVQRTAALASEAGVTIYDENVARSCWDQRCEGVHGGPFLSADATLSPENSVLADYKSMESVLRLSVRRAIEDSELHAIFSDYEAIRRRWPVKGC